MKKYISVALLLISTLSFSYALSPSATSVPASGTSGVSITSFTASSYSFPVGTDPTFNLHVSGSVIGCLFTIDGNGQSSVRGDNFSWKQRASYVPPAAWSNLPNPFDTAGTHTVRVRCAPDATTWANDSSNSWVTSSFNFTTTASAIQTTSGNSSGGSASAYNSSDDGDEDGDFPCLDLKTNLKLGDKDSSTGGAVSYLQEFLFEKGHLTVEPNGFFGSATKRAVKKYQENKNITDTSKKRVVNGIVGPTVRGDIKKDTCSNGSVTSGASGNSSTSGTTNASLIPRAPTVTATPGIVGINDKVTFTILTIGGPAVSYYNFKLSTGSTLIMSDRINGATFSKTPAELGISPASADRYIDVIINACNNAGCSSNTSDSVRVISVKGASSKPEISSFRLESSTIKVGKWGVLSYNVTKASSCKLSGPIGDGNVFQYEETGITNQVRSGSAINTQGTYTVSLTCTGSGGTTSTSTQLVVTNKPEINLYANGGAVADNGTITATNGSVALQWGSVGATSCTLNGTSVPSSGSQVFNNLTAGAHTYTCANSDGSASIVFNVAVTTSASTTTPQNSFAVPVIYIYANGGAVADNGTITAINGSVKLQWGGTGATSCTLNGSPVSTSGSQTLNNLTTSSHTYTCTNSAGSTSVRFNVNVPLPTTLTFTMPSVAGINDNITLSWGGGNNGTTYYQYIVNGGYYTRLTEGTYSWTGKPSELGLTVNTSSGAQFHGVAVRACNTYGCSQPVVRNIKINSTSGVVQ